MPTIKQLPVATQVNAEDEVPLSQAGETKSATVGSLLTGMQPAITTDSATLLGRVSIGPGGPETVTIGTGLVLSGSALGANGADHATFPSETTLNLTDEVILNSAGAPRRLPLASLRGLFSAGSNVVIDGSGAISAIAGGTATQGPAGPPGPAGANGANVWTGLGAPSATLGFNNDSYINGTTGDVYVKVSSAWAKIGNLTGPVGPAGLQGPAGAPGPQGAAGFPGAVGARAHKARAELLGP